MNFNDLFEYGIDEYCTNVFDTHSMLFYVHIPKCSGTSSVNHLKDIFKKHWHFEYNKIKEKWPIFLNSAKNGNIDFAAGHFEFEEVKSLSESKIPHFKISFLRNPIERLISEYRYMCTPAHPPYENFVKECPTFDAFVQKKVRPNRMAEILVGGATSFDEYLNKLKSHYQFIGLSEFYNLSSAILFKALNEPYEVKKRKNVTKTIPQNTFIVSHQTYKRLEEMQSLDIQVFNYIYSQYAKISDPFIASFFQKH